MIPLTLSQVLDAIREDTLDILWQKFAALRLTSASEDLSLYIFSLEEPEQIVALRLCLLVHASTNGKEIPKVLQLQAACTSIKQDTLVIAGTGFGKTHIMALLMLLEKSSSNSIIITITPTMRLQTTQVRRIFYSLHPTNFHFSSKLIQRSTKYQP